MNLPLAGTEFLPDAFRLCRPGGTIHFYSLVSAKASIPPGYRNWAGRCLPSGKSGRYSPGQWHAVYDIRVVVPWRYLPMARAALSVFSGSRREDLEPPSPSSMSRDFFAVQEYVNSQRIM